MMRRCGPVQGGTGTTAAWPGGTLVAKFDSIGDQPIGGPDQTAMLRQS